MQCVSKEAEESQKALDRIRQSIEKAEKQKALIEEELSVLREKLRRETSEQKIRKRILNRYALKEKFARKIKKVADYAEKCRSWLTKLESYGVENVHLLPDEVLEIYDRYTGLCAELCKAEDYDQEKEVEFLKSVKDSAVIALAHVFHLDNIPYLDIYQGDKHIKGLNGHDATWNSNWLEGKGEINNALVNKDNEAVFKIFLNGLEIEEDKSFRKNCLTMDNPYGFSITTNGDVLEAIQIDAKHMY